MAARNSRKDYSPDTYYHIYNRGVEKRLIFQDEQDYAVFLSYLKTYLLPKDENKLHQTLANPNITCREREKILQEIRLNNFNQEITLLSYCLMPNHFHLLVKQESSSGIDKFMNSLGVRYSMFFNKKYKRVGSLFQDVYKAVRVESEEQLLYLTSYIHRNPLEQSPASKEDVLRAYTRYPSSYPEY
ncbi:MAG: transposase, partial [bacterium]|nr:transposase [bacterium]